MKYTACAIAGVILSMNALSQQTMPQQYMNNAPISQSHQPIMNNSPAPQYRPFKPHDINTNLFINNRPKMNNN